MKKLMILLTAALMALCLCVSATAESADTASLTIACPSGAPALALAALAAESPEQYRFVAADTIAAEFSGATADFIVAPINAGAKLYKAGKSTYRLAAVLSWGNLYFASQREGFQLSDINGAELTLFGENTINASIALYALAHNDLTPGNVAYLAGAANTQQLLLTDAEAIVLTAEPALTAAKMKNEKITAYALNDLYKAATGEEGYTQAGLFVKAELAEGNTALTDAYLQLVAASCDKCASDPEAVAEAAVKLEIMAAAKAVVAALPNCAIRYMSAPEARTHVETTANIDLTQFGGALPADDFYYGTK